MIITFGYQLNLFNFQISLTFIFLVLFNGGPLEKIDSNLPSSHGLKRERAQRERMFARFSVCFFERVRAIITWALRVSLEETLRAGRIRFYFDSEHSVRA